ncbi:MAG: MmoB/DmpM family protein [Rhodospirillaceae bacterium]|nr:MmoB/DmpM family protein [Rhodospirillaceae bacterium]
MSADQAARRNAVGPVLRAGEVADAVVEALQEDNPGKEFRVEDRVAYVRAETEGECVVRAETVARVLGRPFKIAELEVNLSSFSGRIETTDDTMRFYFEKRL